MNASTEIGELAKALAAAQAAFPAITRNREVTVKSDKGSYKFDYATLDHILELTKEARAANGLALSWGCRPAGEGWVAVGRLMHVSGQWIESELPLPSGPMKAQELGSCLTYRKRYIADQLLGLSASEDDDANAEEGNHAEFRNRTPPPRKLAIEADSFPPTTGNVGKPPAQPAAASKAPEPPAGPPMTKEALEALALLDLCRVHAAKFGRGATNEEVKAFEGDTGKKPAFGLDEKAVAGLRAMLIGQLLSPK